jgi:WD40 repeat protein
VGLRAVAVSRDGRVVASGDDEGEIRIWQADTGAALLALHGHRGEVLDLAFEEPGWLVSGGADRTLRRWEIGLVASIDTAYRRACALANRNLDGSETEQFFAGPLTRPTCPHLPAAAATSAAP